MVPRYDVSTAEVSGVGPNGKAWSLSASLDVHYDPLLDGDKPGDRRLMNDFIILRRKEHQLFPGSEGASLISEKELKEMDSTARLILGSYQSTAIPGSMTIDDFPWCRILGITGTFLMHSCQSRDATSGAPLFVILKDSSIRVLGTHTGTMSPVGVIVVDPYDGKVVFAGGLVLSQTRIVKLPDGSTHIVWNGQPIDWANRGLVRPENLLQP
jgi:hypothetical protein